MNFFEGELMAHKRGPSGEAIRISGDIGRSISADSGPSGSITNTTQAVPRHNEAGTLEVCQKLIERLNRDGENWTNCRLSEKQDDDIDCLADRGNELLEIQVTRAVPNSDFWKGLSKVGGASYELESDQVAKELFDAISLKSHVARNKLVLALDAIETPGHVMESVTRAFRRNHHLGAKVLGFRAIWLVGPGAIAVRLDE